MLTIAICDDNPQFAKILAKKINSLCAHNLPERVDCQIAPIFGSAENVLQFLQTQAIHILFLDIDMPKINGFKLAEYLCKHYPETIIIFVSSYEEFVYSSFEYCPFRFLRKSHLEQELPIKILVFNNTVLGMVRQLQYHYSGQRYSGVHFSKTVDFMALAKAYGAAGYQITSKEEAPGVLKEAFGNGRFSIVEIAIDPDDLCLPIVLGGHSIDDMVLEPQD